MRAFKNTFHRLHTSNLRIIAEIGSFIQSQSAVSQNQFQMNKLPLLDLKFSFISARLISSQVLA